MSEPKSSLICTVYNEEKTIILLLKSVINQSILPDEVIIVDGGSKDNTVEEIKKFSHQFSKKLKIKVFTKKGNRSVGRNIAILKSSNQLILCTDSGCVLDKKWVENILKPFRNKNVDVVAGFYEGISKNIFQKSLIPYVLVMKDNIYSSNFIPATRSMAFRKKVFTKLRGFNEKLSHNEDYDFGNRIKSEGFKIHFQQNAVVYWIPRNNIFQSFKMFFRFSLGDIQANLYRPKVIYLVLRYTVAIYLIVLSLIMKSQILNILIIVIFISYVLWAIFKNYRYVNNYKAFFYLPLLQFISDFAVLSGTITGLIGKISIKKILDNLNKNKFVLSIIFIYVITLFAIIDWGIPNKNHPFNYFMDEWHQSQSVRYLFKLGTPNLPGAANGSIFQFFLTGIYLVPFYLLGIINPFAIKSSVTNLELQTRLFEILRLNTILFGALSIIVFYFIAKRYFKVNPIIATFLFVFNPLWIMLSNYYKYDIALIFWVLISFYLFLKYVNDPKPVTFILAGIFTGLALSTKLLTPIPLVLTYFSVFFLFTPGFKEKSRLLFTGGIVCILTYIVFGNPDILLGKGSLYDYVYSNVILGPKLTSNYILGINPGIYLVSKLYPAIFGITLYFTFVFSAIVLLSRLIKPVSFLKDIFLNKKNPEVSVLFLAIVFFILSLIPIGIQATNNRMIVLLPFMALGSGLLLEGLYRRIKNSLYKYIYIFLIIVLMSLQLLQTYSWMSFKTKDNIRTESSAWILANIKRGSTIGIENIPIYQMLPDLITKEYYFNQYKIQEQMKYKYEIISAKSINIPGTVIITNDVVESTYLKRSDKKDLVKKLLYDGYNLKKRFYFGNKYFNFLNNDLDYFMSGLVQLPNTISVYEK